MRWTYHDKIAVVEAVRRGTVELHTALEAHEVSLEEFQEWERAYDTHGREALKSTKLQAFRVAERRRKTVRIRITTGKLEDE